MKTNVKSSGVGFCGLLTIVLITLKLLSVIDWSWGWVLAPIWMPIVLWIVAIILLIAIHKKQ